MEKLSTDKGMGVYDPYPIVWIKGIPQVLPTGMSERKYKQEIKKRWNLTPRKVDEYLTMACKSGYYDNLPIIEVIHWIGIETRNERKQFEENIKDKKWLKPEISNPQ